MASIELKGLPQLRRRIEAIADTAMPIELMKAWQIRTTALAKAKVRRKTGNLGRSIHPGAVTPHSARVEASAGYAAYVEFGTKPHVIVPRYAKVLAWGGARRLTGSLRSGSSATTFAMRVQHPGTQPYPFLRPAASEALEAIGMAGVVINAWNEAA